MIATSTCTALPDDDRIEWIRQIQRRARTEDKRVVALPLSHAPDVCMVRSSVQLIEGRGATVRQATVELPINIRESWLRLAWWRRWITQRQHDAGMRLRDTFELSSLHTERAADYTRPYVDGGGDNDARLVNGLENARKYAGMVAAIDEQPPGLPYGRICADVAVADMAPRALARRYGWRDSNALPNVRDALDRLGDLVWGKGRRL